MDVGGLWVGGGHLALSWDLCITKGALGFSLLLLLLFPSLLCIIPKYLTWLESFLSVEMQG